MRFFGLLNALRGAGRGVTFGQKNSKSVKKVYAGSEEKPRAFLIWENGITHPEAAEQKHNCKI